MTLNDKTPFFAFSNDELGDPVEGDTVLCEVCGNEHKIEYGMKKLDSGEFVPSKTLGFVRCGENAYLVTFNGRKIR